MNTLSMSIAFFWENAPMLFKKHYKQITVSLPVEYHSELTKIKKKLNVSLQDLVILSVGLFIEGKERHKLMSQ